MRPAASRVAIVALALGAAWLPSSAAAQDEAPGAFDEEVIAGVGADEEAGGAGEDFLAGGEGSDELAGGPGGDLIVDLAGDDVVRGGDGPDRITVRDLVGGDRVSCGGGDDLVIADAGDRVAPDCEQNLGPGHVRVRRDAAALSQEARARFVDAVLALKRTPSPFSRKVGWYDQFVDWHEDAFGRKEIGAHGGPGFLPWHRAFLLTFEDALSLAAGRQITVPYWDWSRQQSTDAVFSESLLGPTGDPQNGFAVSEGAFQRGKWRIRVRDEAGTTTFAPELPQPEEGPFIERNIASFPNAGLPDRATIRSVLGVSAYDGRDWDGGVPPIRSFRNALEGGVLQPAATGTHNSVHMWTAGTFEKGEGPQIGTMGLGTSPNDPVFWLHHNQIDRVWESWLGANGRAYRPVNKGPRSQRRDSTLRPFARYGMRFTPRRLLNPKKLGYRYADLPQARRQPRELAAGGREWMRCTIAEPG